jgi:hypothetical protein
MSLRALSTPFSVWCFAFLGAVQRSSGFCSSTNVRTRFANWAGLVGWFGSISIPLWLGVLHLLVLLWLCLVTSFSFSLYGGSLGDMGAALKNENGASSLARQ